MFKQGENVTVFPAWQILGTKLTASQIQQSEMVTVFLASQSPIGPIPPEIGTPLAYRMRAFDSGLGRMVFWNSPMVDGAGLDYAGPGPILDVVVSILIGS
jgi:hypothetical protein